MAKKRGAKTVVKREVVRVVTPGTLVEDTLLDARANNYLVAIARAERNLAIAWVDVSTGDVAATPTEQGRVAGELGRLNPGELLVSDRLVEMPELGEILADWDSVLTTLPAARFDSQGRSGASRKAMALPPLKGSVRSVGPSWRRSAATPLRRAYSARKASRSEASCQDPGQRGHAHRLRDAAQP